MLEWLVQNAWAGWLVLFLVLVGVEALSLDLWFAMLAGGALGGLAVALFGGEIWVQITVFALLSLVLLVLLRPVALRHLRRSDPDARTNIDRLVGADALVLEPTSRLTGTAKIDGEVWTARSAESAALAPGTHAVVARIDGATAFLVTAQKA